MTENATTSQAPAIQVREAIIAHLRSSAELAGIDDGQIRAMLDVSGTPRGDRAIIVSARDLGGHGGMPGRVLIDVEASISIMTNLDEDPSGSAADELLSSVAIAIENISYSLNGWRVPFRGIWKGTHATTADESFRLVNMTATLYLQKTN